jgi:hypothetical protein
MLHEWACDVSRSLTRCRQLGQRPGPLSAISPEIDCGIVTVVAASGKDVMPFDTAAALVAGSPQRRARVADPVQGTATRWS